MIPNTCCIAYGPNLIYYWIAEILQYLRTNIEYRDCETPLARADDVARLLQSVAVSGMRGAGPACWGAGLAWSILVGPWQHGSYRPMVRRIHTGMVHTGRADSPICTRVSWARSRGVERARRQAVWTTRLAASRAGPVSLALQAARLPGPALPGTPAPRARQPAAPPNSVSSAHAAATLARVCAADAVRRCSPVAGCRPGATAPPAPGRGLQHPAGYPRGRR